MSVKVWVRDEEFGEDFEVSVAVEDLRVALVAVGANQLIIEDEGRMAIMPWGNDLIHHSDLPDGKYLVWELPQ